MTAPTTSPAAVALRRAAVRATLAPSLRNTQPWRIAIGADTVEIHADPDRRSLESDPAGRQLLISCGCALLNARVSLAANGYQVRVSRFPDPTVPELLARLTIDDEPVTDPTRPAGIGALDAAIDSRRTNRRRFAAEAVPIGVVDSLVAAAAAEGARLVSIARPEDRLSLAIVRQLADAQQTADPSHRGDRSSLASGTSSGPDDCLLLLCTDRDDPAAWLRAGEALEHALLRAAYDGYAVSRTTDLIEVPPLRAMLRQRLRLAGQPHVLLQIGRAPATPATRRRRLVDVLVDSV